MYLPIYPHNVKAEQETFPGIALTGSDLLITFRMFINAFGVKPLRDHSDLSRHQFYDLYDLRFWELAIALQIAVDVTSSCESEDERVLLLKKHFRDLLGPCEHETLVRIQNVPDVIERPPVPF
jgi:hypothetical protein